MTSETISSADHKMNRAVEAMERDFQAFRTGRASTCDVSSAGATASGRHIGGLSRTYLTASRR